MSFKNILRKFIKPSQKNKLKITSDDSYCYSKIIWNCSDNLIILISFTDDYFEQIIELQDAINHPWCYLNSKIVFSSYDEEITTKDENGNDVDGLLIHNKHYILIGGDPLYFNQLYSCINNLSNEAINTISNEIINNCDPKHFKALINDGILPSFSKAINYDTPKKASDNSKYTDPEMVLKRLPEGFTGRDIIKFISIVYPNLKQNAFSVLLDIKYMTDEYLKQHALYDLYNTLFKDVTVSKLNILTEPLYN